MFGIIKKICQSPIVKATALLLVLVFIFSHFRTDVSVRASDERVSVFPRIVEKTSNVIDLDWDGVGTSSFWIGENSAIVSEALPGVAMSDFDASWSALLSFGNFVEEKRIVDDIVSSSSLVASSSGAEIVDDSQNIGEIVQSVSEEVSGVSEDSDSVEVENNLVEEDVVEDENGDSGDVEVLNDPVYTEEVGVGPIVDVTEEEVSSQEVSDNEISNDESLSELISNETVSSEAVVEYSRDEEGGASSDGEGSSQVVSPSSDSSSEESSSGEASQESSEKVSMKNDSAFWDNFRRDTSSLLKHFYAINSAKAQDVEISSSSEINGVAENVSSSSFSLASSSVISTRDDYDGLVDSLIFSDFAMADSWKENEITNVQLRLSLAGRSNFSDDELLIEYALGGSDSWEEAGRLSLFNEVSNASNDGYYLYALPVFPSWNDVAAVKVRVSYLHHSLATSTDLLVGGASIFVDSAWMEVDYSPSKEIEIEKVVGEEEIGEKVFFDQDEIDVDGKKIKFSYTDNNDDESLIIKTDRANYIGLSEAEVYLSVTNSSDRDDRFGLQAYFPSGVGDLISMEKLSRVNEEASDVVFGDSKFSCPESWVSATGSDYICSSTATSKNCAYLENSGLSCVIENTPVGDVPKIVKKDYWKKVGLKGSELSERRNVIERIFGIGPKKKRVDRSFAVKKSTEGESYSIGAGETQFFRLKISFPLGSSGEFYVETIGDETYGLLDPWWSASWNYERPINITYSGVAKTDFQIALNIDTATLISTGKMQNDCDDIRFSDSSRWATSSELSYYLEAGTCNRTNTKVWVKLSSLTGNRTIYMYYGNVAAASASNGSNTFVYFNDFESTVGFDTDNHVQVYIDSRAAKDGLYGIKSDSPENIYNKWRNGVSIGRDYVVESWIYGFSSSTPTMLSGLSLGVNDYNAGYNAVIDNRSSGPRLRVVRDGNYTSSGYTICTSTQAVTPSLSTWYYMSFYWATGNRLGAAVYDNATSSTPILQCSSTNMVYNSGSYGVAGFRATAWDNYRVRKYATSTISSALGTEVQITNHSPLTPYNMIQYRSDAVSMIPNRGWSMDSTVYFSATSTDKDGDFITTYYQVIGTNDTYATATSAPASACLSGISYAACTSKYWTNFGSWSDADFNYRTKITALATQVTADLTNFPVFLNMSALGVNHPIWSNMREDGGDLMITNSTGTRLPLELVRVSTSTKTGELYFRADTLADLANTDFYLYYGSSTASQPASTTTYGARNVWSNGYRGVWHLNESGVGVRDSTSYANNSSSVGGNPTFGATGKLGYAINFSGTNYILIPSDNDLEPTTNLTISSWINRGATQNDYAKPFWYGTNGADPYPAYGFEFNAASDSDLSFGSAAGGAHRNTPVYTTTANTWIYLVGTYDGTTFRLYTDGTQRTTLAYTGTISNYDNVSGLGIGNRYELTQGFTGSVDEVRIAASTRSATWISTEHNNMNGPYSFFSTSTEEVLPLTKLVAVTSIPDSAVGYKWQSMSCDSKNLCSGWTRFDNATPNFMVDTVNPTVPGPLTSSKRSETTITVRFGTASSDTNFAEYKIFYKAGSSGVKQSDLVWGSSSDSDLSSATFSGTATTTITGLNSGTQYVFNIFAYDLAGRVASATTEVVISTAGYPRDPEDLVQYKTGATILNNGDWTNLSQVSLYASSTGNERYFQLVDNSTSFTSATTTPVSPCFNNTEYAACTNKIWKSSWPWYGNSFPYRVRVTADSAYVDADLNNFPMYFNVANIPVDSNFWNHVREDGGDIVMTSDDGITRLPLELVSFATSTHSGEMYFKGNVENSTSTIFYIYYGSSTASQPAFGAAYGRNAVWTNGFEAVWHLNSITSLSDSTGNGHNGTYSGNPTNYSSGRLGGAIAFDGVGDYISTGVFGTNTIDFGNADYTASFWVRPTDTTAGALMAKGTNDTTWSSNEKQFFFTSVAGAAGNGLIPNMVGWGCDWQGAAAGNTVTSGAWNQLVYSRTDSTNTKAIYINNTSRTLVGNYNTTNTADTNTWILYLGRRISSDVNPNEDYHGVMDEVRLSSTTRSSTWLSTEYNNQNSNSSYFGVSSEESLSAGVNPITVLRIPDSVVGYKWRAMTCNSDGCSDWVSYNLATPNFYVDATSPTRPGNLTVDSTATDRMTINFGSATVESNFAYYRIYYHVGTTTDPRETDFVWDSFSDPNLASRTFNGAGSTTITNLLPNTSYSFLIFAYDLAGNKASSSVRAYSKTKFYAANPSNLQQWRNSTELIENGGWTNSSTVQFLATSTGAQGTVYMYYEVLANGSSFITSTSTPASYCSSGTSFGSCASRVWRGQGSRVFVPGLPDSATGYKWQVISCNEDTCSKNWTVFNASQPNFMVDTVAPTVPGNLTIDAVSPTTITLNLGSVVTESNFAEYKIYARPGAGVTESDYLWGSSSDSDLSSRTFNGTGSTTVTGLTASTTYYFNIWAYDLAGNRTKALVEAYRSTQGGLFNPSSLVQYYRDTPLSNGEWTSSSTVGFSATSSNSGGYTLLYYQVIAANSSFTTATTTPGSPCYTGTNYGACVSKVWYDANTDASSWYNLSYPYRVRVTTNNSKVDADLTDFPVYLNLSVLGVNSPFWNNVKSNGGDILVTNSSGTRLPLELVSISTTNKTGEMYFKGNLNNNSDTDFYIYYGYAAATQPASTTTYGSRNVWTNGYRGVWHLSESAGSTAVRDSTSYSNHSSAISGPTLGSSGKIGTSVLFSGANRILIPTSNNLEPARNLVFSLWINRSATQNTWAKPLWYGSNATNPYPAYGYEFNDTSDTDIVASVIAGGARRTVTPYTTSAGTWAYLVASYDGTTLRYYANGSEYAQTAYTGTISNYDNTSGLGIGDRYETGQGYAGYVDEVRIASTTRTSGWVSTEYNNMNSPETFFSTGTATSFPLPYKSIKVNSFPQSSIGYKWRVLACNQYSCSKNWTDFNVTTPNFKVDTTAPTAPGNLTLAGRRTDTIVLGFGSASSELHFSQYKIFWKQGMSGVTQYDNLHGSSTDINLANINYNSASTTEISGLLPNTRYVFNIFAYDQTGKIASATEQSFQTSNLVTETYSYTSGSSAGWINSPYAWDGNDDTYAYRDIPGSSANDSSSYLLGAANNAVNSTKKILMVEMGLEGYSQDSDAMDFVIQPIFLGLTAGATSTLDGSLYGRIDGDGTYYVDITSDANAPASWTWNDVINLDARVYGLNSSSTNVRAYVDQIRLRIAVDAFPEVVTNQEQRYANGTTSIPVDSWINADSLNLKAEGKDPDSLEKLFLYFQLVPTTTSFITSTSTKSIGACSFGTAYNSCTSTVWTAAYVGDPRDFSVVPFVGSTTVTSIPDGSYKWQVIACDDDDVCSPSWTRFSASSTHVRVDTTKPASPGGLSFVSHNSGSIVISFGAQTVEDNFARYRIYYRKSSTTAPMESDLEHADSNLNYIDYNGAATTTISGLSKSSEYLINIWAYDRAGNKASATVPLLASTTDGYILSETSYLIENDDGASVNLNTSPSLANVPLSGVEKGQRVNVRFQIQNTGFDQTYNKRYKIQYENNTDYPGLWYDVGGSSDIAYSYGLSGANGDAITSAKGSVNGNIWVNGLWQEGTGLSNFYNLAVNSYTEIAFSLQTVNAIAGKTYRLRVIDGSGSSTLESFSNYPALTMTSSPVKRYSKNAVSSLPSGYSDLTYYLDNQGYLDTASNNASRDSIIGSPSFMVFNFVSKLGNYDYGLSASWDGQTTLSPATNPVFLQIYRFGTVNSWVTVTSNNSAAINTDFTLAGSVSYQMEDYFDSNFNTYWRVYQSSGSGTLRTDYYNLSTTTLSSYVSQNHYRWRNDDGSIGYNNWYNDDYTYRRLVTLDNSLVPGRSNQSEFTVLISMTDLYLRSTAFSGHVQNSSGYDILFTSASGTAVKLDYEIEKYTPSTGELVAWVRLPALFPLNDTYIYMYYGNATTTASQENISGTWGSNNRAVWHLDESGASTTRNDSTANANNASTEGYDGDEDTATNIDGTDDFDGTNDHLSVVDSNSLDITSGVSISGWFNPDNTATLGSLTSGGYAQYQLVGMRWGATGATDCTPSSSFSPSSINPYNGAVYGQSNWLTGGFWKMVDTSLPTVYADSNQYTVDFNDVWGSAADNSESYVASYIYSPRQKQVTFSVGSNDSRMIWINGQLVSQDCANQSLVLDDQSFNYTLKQGWNTFVMFVSNGNGSYSAQWRISSTTQGMYYTSNPRILVDKNEYQLALKGAYLTASYGAATVDYSISASSWQYFTLAGDSSSIDLYINGVSRASSSVTTAASANTEPLRLGYLFDGKLDEVVIRNVKDSKDRVKANYNNHINQGVGSGKFVKSLSSEQTYTGASASWRENEDVGSPILGAALNRNENIRLRLSLSNTSGGASVSTSYRLQYASTSVNCFSGVGSWYDLPVYSTAQHFEMSSSTYVINQQLTSKEFTDTEGYSFVSGSAVEEANATSASISLLQNEYTELEWVIRASHYAKDGTTYCFRVVNNSGGLLDSYDRYAEVTMSGTTNTAPSFTYLPGDGGSATSTPTTNGYDVNFRATALDSQGDEYYLAICQTNSVAVGNGIAPTCPGGSWCVSNLASSSQEASCSYTTNSAMESLDWYAFVCDLRWGAGVAKCSASSQGEVPQQASSSPFKINHRPSFTALSTTVDFRDPGGVFTISASGGDTDANGPDDTMYFYACRTNSATFSSGCVSGQTICSSTGAVSLNPSCTYTDVAPTPAGANTYYGFVFDSHGASSSPSVRSNTYTINNVMPVLGSTVLNGGSDITLNLKGAANRSVQVVNTSVTDQNGCQSLVSATAAVFLSSVSGSFNCTADGNNCYQIGTGNCLRSDCSGADDAIATYTCTVGMRFYAIPTDNSSNNPWSSDNWLSRIQVYDGANYAATTSAGVEVNTNAALEIAENTIDFGGSLSPGDNTGATNQEITVVNYGNSPLDGDLEGSSLRSQIYDYISANNIEWSLTSGFSYFTGNDLSTTPQTVGLALGKPTSDTDLSDNIYWGIGLPATTTGGTFEGSTTLSAVLDGLSW